MGRAARPQQEASAAFLCVPEGCNRPMATVPDVCTSLRLTHGARPAWRSTELSPAAGVQVRLGRAPGGDTGEVRGGAGGWARVQSGFVFPMLCRHAETPSFDSAGHRAYNTALAQ